MLLSVTTIAVLLVSDLFLYTKNQSLKKEIAVLNDRISELQKPKQGPITEKPLEGWKEYIDEEYEFRIWYPEEFTAFEETAEVIVNKLKNNYDYKNNWIKQLQVLMPLTSDAPLHLLHIYIYNSSLNIKEFIRDDVGKYIKDIDDINKYLTHIKLNELDFYKFDNGELVSSYVKKDNRIFVFDSEITESAYKHLNKDQIFDQMIHSFKFID